MSAKSFFFQLGIVCLVLFHCSHAIAQQATIPTSNSGAQALADAGSDVAESSDGDAAKASTLNLIPDAQVQEILTKLSDLNSVLNNRNEIDGATALVILLIGSFVVDRLSGWILLALSAIPWWKRNFPYPQHLPAGSNAAHRDRARMWLTLFYYFLSYVIAVALTISLDLKLLTALGIENILPIVEPHVTALVIVIGAERIAHWMQTPGIPGIQNSDQTVQVAGELVVREPESQAAKANSNAS